MSRRRAREVALQTLFSLDFNQCEAEAALDTVFNERTEISDKAKAYTRLLVIGVKENLAQIDELINHVSIHWKIERMGSIDRNITRLAIYEMKYGAEKIDYNVIINEAIEVAKSFGGDDSSKFINGILGNLVKQKK